MKDRHEDSLNFPEGEIYLARLDELFEEYKAGKLPTKIYIRKVGETADRLQQTARIAERERLNLLEEKYNIESLGTDNQGRRSTQQLAESGKAFATGVASRCLTVAFVHPDKGIGAAHYNPLTRSIVEKSVAQHLVSRDMHEQITILTNTNRASRMINDTDLAAHASKVITSAFTEFKAIPSENRISIPSGTTVLLAGFDFLDDKKATNVKHSATQIIQNLVQFEQRGTGRQTNLSVRFHLQDPQGIIYGGKDHPNFANPEFYYLT